jgi:hypothetical protein
MNCSRETVKMGVPPGNHRVLNLRRTWNGTAQGEPVLSLSKEHQRTPGRTAISAVAVTPGREFMKHPG